VVKWQVIALLSALIVVPPLVVVVWLAFRVWRLQFASTAEGDPQGLWKLEGNFQFWPLEATWVGQGQLRGMWAFVVGAQLSKLVLTATMTRGFVGQIQIFIQFRKRKRVLWERTLPAWFSELRAQWKEARSTPKTEKPRSRWQLWLQRWGRAFAKKLDPFDTLLFALDTRHSVHFEKLEIGGDFALNDVFLMGQTWGILCLLGAVLPGNIRIGFDPLWGQDEQFQIEAQGSIRLLPRRLVKDVIRFVFEQLRQARKRQRLAAHQAAVPQLPAATNTEKTNESQDLQKQIQPNHERWLPPTFSGCNMDVNETPHELRG
jgi:hypothetical protein